MTSQQNIFESGQDSNDQPSSVEDSPASPFLLPGSEEARKMTATSGRKCFALLPSSGPLGCLAKMLLGSSIWASPHRYLTWKARGTKCGVPYFQLVPSAPRTKGTGFSFWPTPSATPRGAHTGEEAGEVSEDGLTRISANGTRWGATLETTVAAREKMWPTPNARDHKGAPSAKWGSQASLPREVKMWPTPRAGNPGSRKPGTGGKVLAEEAKKSVQMWPTPTSRDHKDTGDCANVPTNSLLGREVGPSKESGSLNPAWVEWLKGLPPGWTDLKHSETR